MTFYKDMYDRTLELGVTKLANGSEDAKVQGPRIGTGGGFPGIFLWDTAFCIFWMRYHQDLFPCTVSLDNFYRLQQEGFSRLRHPGYSHVRKEDCLQHCDVANGQIDPSWWCYTAL